MVPHPQATAAPDPHGIGWTLHELRHSALQHLAADGRTAPELQARSRHLHLGSLGRYVQLGEQTSAQVTAEAEPADGTANRCIAAARSGGNANGDNSARPDTDTTGATSHPRPAR